MKTFWIDLISVYTFNSSWLKATNSLHFFFQIIRFDCNWERKPSLGNNIRNKWYPKKLIIIKHYLFNILIYQSFFYNLELLFFMRNTIYIILRINMGFGAARWNVNTFRGIYLYSEIYHLMSTTLKIGLNHIVEKNIIGRRQIGINIFISSTNIKHYMC